MAVRLATEADVPLILRRLAELENPPNENAESIMRYLEDDVVMVDDDVGALCGVLRNPGYELIIVRWLLPLLSRGRLAPLAYRSLDAACSRWPRDVDWRLEGSFDQGKDANMEPDDGLAICLAWQQWFETDADTKPVVRGETTPYVSVSGYTGRPCVWWTLRELRDRMGGLLGVVSSA